MVKKMSKKLSLGITIVMLIASVIILGVSVYTPEVIGVNTSITKTYLNITNTPPEVYKVECQNPANLQPGTTTKINCTAYVYDYNGWQDVANGTVNGTFWHIDESSYEAADNANNHYTNVTCLSTEEESCLQLGSSATNATCTCSFSVQYFAYNGTWQVNITVSDTHWLGGDNPLNLTDSGTGFTNITPLVALDVPASLDYGDLAVTQYSSMKELNITNFGNVGINISMYGYGGDNYTLFNNTALMCPVGNISLTYERWARESSKAWADMYNVTAVDAKMDINIPKRIDEQQYNNSRNTTYWKVYVPQGVGGFCNGSLVFSAQKN